MLDINFPLQPQDIALVLNGARCRLDIDAKDFQRQHWKNYQKIVVVDGAWDDFCASEVGRYWLERQKDGQKDSLICIGDGDSIATAPKDFMVAPDQDYTDFDKALQWAVGQGYHSADVYWGSGGEMDHFLGNLSVAAKYSGAIALRFVDDWSYYFYLSEKTAGVCIRGGGARQISLYPFPQAVVTAKGLRYPLDNLPLDLIAQQSLRNHMDGDRVDIARVSGQLWCFIGRSVK